MPQIINQYSYIIIGLFLLLVMGILLAWRRKGFHLREAGLLFALGLVLLFGWFVLQPESAAPVTADQIRAQIGNGKPVLLEFQSPY